QQRDECKRFSERQGADDRRRPHFVGANEFNDLLGDGMDLVFERHRTCVTTREVLAGFHPSKRAQEHGLLGMRASRITDLTLRSAAAWRRVSKDGSESELDSRLANRHPLRQ